MMNFLYGTSVLGNIEPTALQMLIAIVGSGALGSFVTGMISRGASKADAAKSITDASDQIVRQMSSRFAAVAEENARLAHEISQLKKTIPGLETKIDELTDAVHVLSTQLVEAGIQPAYTPGKLF